MKEITIYDERLNNNDHRVLTVKINDKGDLIMEGYDSGDSVEKFWGDFDYEFWITIKENDVPSVLLWLIKERFNTSTEFKNWLINKKIEHDFQTWI